MKKTSLIPIIIILVGSILFSSCNSELSVAKRRYNKGFYVHYNPKKHAPPVAENKNKYTNLQKISLASEAPPKTEIAANEEKSVKNIPQEHKITASVPQKTKNHKTPKEKRINKVAPVIGLAMTEPIRFARSLPELGVADAGDQALSLLWVVIVVLLILYLLGLLFDVAGGSWLIHLFAVVIVVLLILWLLRIL